MAVDRDQRGSRRVTCLIAILATVALMVALSACKASIEPQRLLIPTALTCVDCPAVTVTGAIDGDTLGTTEGSIRLFGIDTPEEGQRCYSEAAKRLSELAGTTIRVEAGSRATGPYGRRLFYAYTYAGYSIDAVLISEGLARAWIRDGQHRNYMVSLEDSAREQGVGCLWSR